MNYEKVYRDIRADKSIPAQDREDFGGFIQFFIATAKTPNRVVKYLYSLRRLSKLFGKPFRDITKADVEKVIAIIEANKKYSEWTKRDYKIIIRNYMKWLRGMTEGNEYPEEVKWLKTKLKNKTRLPEEILTEQEVLELAKHTNSSRDKAFVLAVYESGCRIDELRQLRIKHMSFDEYGCRLRVTGKTGDRVIRLVSSSPALSQWKENHPYKNDAEAFLWISQDTKNPYRPVSYTILHNILTGAGKKAGIQKRVNPHSFRHARATHLASKLTEAQMKDYFGWTLDSGMVASYVHMSGRDIDDAILRANGIRKNGQEGAIIRLQSCESCHALNDPVAMFCTKCNYPMDMAEQRNQKNEAVNNLVMQFLSLLAEQNPKIKDDFRQLVRKNNLEGLFK